MKKITLILLIACLFLASCGGGIPENCLNTPAYCQIGGTVYREYGPTLRRFSAACPEGMSLCLDPLCSHDTVCPESIHIYHTASDGEYIYARGVSYSCDGGMFMKTAEDNGNIYMMNAVYRIDLSSGGMKQLAEFSTVGGEVTGISTDGEYVYYVEAFYSESGEPYGVPMRVPCGGGGAESFLGGEYTAYAEIYADRYNYYVTDGGCFTAIDRKNGEKVSAELPCIEAYGVIFHGNDVYLYGLEDIYEYEANCRFLFTRMALWRWNGADFDRVVGDIDMMVWDEDGVWYTPMLPEDEFELIGTAESYDGRGMSPYDFVRTTSGELVHLNLSTGEKQVYAMGSRNLKIEPIGVSNGYIIAACSDLNRLDFEYEYLNLKPEADGTVSIYKAIRPDSEVSQ